MRAKDLAYEFERSDTLPLPPSLLTSYPSCCCRFGDPSFSANDSLILIPALDDLFVVTFQHQGISTRDRNFRRLIQF